MFGVPFLMAPSVTRGDGGLLRARVPGSLAEKLAPQADERSQGPWRRIQGERLHIITPYLRIKCPRPQAHTTAVIGCRRVGSLSLKRATSHRSISRRARHPVAKRLLVGTRSVESPPSRSTAHLQSHLHATSYTEVMPWFHALPSTRIGGASEHGARQQLRRVRRCVRSKPSCLLRSRRSRRSSKLGTAIGCGREQKPHTPTMSIDKGRFGRASRRTRVPPADALSPDASHAACAAR